MPVQAAAPSQRNNLKRSLGESGEKEYRRLLRMLRAAEGQFVLLPIESDFRPALRDALLKRLHADLMANKQRLHIIRLSRESWDILQLLERDGSEVCQDVVAVVGLEETPGIVPEIRAQAKRPPALAVLNSLREPLRKRVDRPVLLWCDPLSYVALQEHAPDFFDHYTALFTFLDAAPLPPLGTEAQTVNLGSGEIPPSGISSYVAVQFYEDQNRKFQEPTKERARALMGLAQATMALHDTNLNVRLQRAEGHLREALALLSPITDSFEWARAQGILGLAYYSLPTGNRTANLRRAIACYEAALRVYNEDDFPYEWAGTQINLGNAYFHLPTSNRAANLQQAISCFEAALLIFTEERFPYYWAVTQSNLGGIYFSLPTGDRAANLQRAIACFESTLRIRTEEKFPCEWAVTQNNLGNAYLSLPTGDRAANVQQAIACFEAALHIFTEERFPYEWATTQNNLGAAYQNLVTGNRTANLQRAIACFEAVLRVYTEKNFPFEWARTQNNLGAAYANLSDRNWANLRRAVAYYEAALRVYTEDKFPYDYARSQYNRSLALRDLGEGKAAYEAAMAAARAYGSTANKDALLIEITQRIVSAFHPHKVILFGSYATGKQREGSDLDILVIMDSQESQTERMRQVYAVAKIPLLEMDILVYTPDEIAQRLEIGDFFIKEILSEGKVLYNRDTV